MTAILSPLPVLQFFDDNGQFLVGGQVFTYLAGTTTKTPSYTDASGTTPNTNPIILDARGDCEIWLLPGTAYKIVLAPATDTDPPTDAIWTVDNITVSSGVFTGTSVTSMTIGLGPVTFQTQAGLELTVGQFVVIADAANPANFMFGQITAYAGTAMTVNVSVVGGSGTFADWIVSLSGVQGPSATGVNRAPLLATVYTATGAFTFTAPSDTLTNDVFEFTVTGAGGAVVTNAIGPNGHFDNQVPGGSGGTAIYIVSGLIAGQTVTGTVGAKGTGGTSGGNSSIIVGATTVTGGGGGVTTGISPFVALGGMATNGTINLPGGDSGINWAVGTTGGESVTGILQGSSSFWGSAGAPGAGGTQATGAADGIVVVKQFRGGGTGQTLSAVAAATTTNLGALATQNVEITGNAAVNITSFGSSANLAAPIYIGFFAGTNTLKYNATSMILPTAADIVTAAGDSFIAEYMGSGNWRVLNYYRASGAALAGGSGSAGGTPGAWDNISAVLATNGKVVTITAAVLTMAADATHSASIVSFSEANDTSGTGAGGIDTGTPPFSSFIAIYGINGLSGTSSLSSAIANSSGLLYTGADPASGYDNSALTAIWPTDGSGNYKAGTLDDGKFYYAGANIVSVSSGSPGATSLTALSLAAACPPTTKSVDLIVSCNDTHDHGISFAKDTGGTALRIAGVTNSPGGGDTLPVIGATVNVYTFLDVPVTPGTPTVAWADSNGTSTTTIYVTGYRFR